MGLVLAGGLGLYFWARSVLSGDAVRATVQAQLSRALGQPVTIGSVHPTIFPRVTLNLNDVTIGQPARVTVRRVHVGTDLRALLSRRIEHADIRFADTRVELPLLEFAFMTRQAPSADGAAAGGVPVEIVSIDTVELTGLEVVSGGRVLRGSVDVVPAGRALTIRSIALAADGTTLDVTGEIADMAGPTGELAVKARGLNVLELLAFITDFSKGAGLAAAPATPAEPDPMPMNLAVSIDADSAVVGTLALARLTGHARVTPDAVALDPVSFGVFGGGYTGTLVWALGERPAFEVKGSLSGIDAGAAMAFAGKSGTITGRLSGDIDLAGRGTSAGQVISSAHGTTRVDVRNGTVARLGLVRAVVLATSMRQDSMAAARRTKSSEPEPFSELGATFAVGGGQARTKHLQFESKDLLLNAAGVLGLRDASVDLSGDVRLSDELSKQAGRDLLRYTRDDGRVTLPVTITGAAGDLTVGIDMSEVLKRAITNRAEEEAKKLLKKALGKIIKE